jgi:hypothetical protein
MLSSWARRAKAVPRGGARSMVTHAWAGPPQACLRVATSPLLLERRGIVGSAWFCMKLVCCSSLPLYAFQKAPFWLCFIISSSYFCNCDYSTGIHGNRSVAHVYVCIDVYFPPFWAYVGGINLSIRTANKLPQVYPLLVLERKLRRWLLIRSCYNADYISNMPGL